MSRISTNRDGAQLASLRQRTLAYLVDLCLIGGPLLAAVHDRDRSLSREIASLLTLATLAGTAYHVVLEGLWGRTAGKALLGIEVARVDGSPCTVRAATIRTAARVVDALPIGYAFGLVSIATSRRRQRIGDRLADTIVIRRLRSTEYGDFGRPVPAPGAGAGGGSRPVAESA